MQRKPVNSFNALQTLTVGDESYQYYDLHKAAEALGKDISKLPYSLKILLENMLRFEDGDTVTKDDVQAFVDWLETKSSDREIAYRPARVLMQDFTGVPGVVDLAAMRNAICNLGGNPELINPLVPVDLVIDHSVQVDEYGKASAFDINVKLEVERNRERYEFLRWGQESFRNFRVVPPGTGICHQVNLEYLAQAVWTDEQGTAYPDTLVGTDSHTTMINGLGVLGWGVGGIEAEAAMLGQPVSMLIPEVIGFKLKGKLNEGVTATDLVLTVTNMLRKKGVVGKFVEFYGEGLAQMSLANRATIGNMAPEYGATCGIFPIDGETIKYMRLTARDEKRVALVEAYAKQQGMWGTSSGDPVFTDTLELDMSTVEPSLAGPKRPQDKIKLSDAAPRFAQFLEELNIREAEQGEPLHLRGEMIHSELDRDVEDKKIHADPSEEIPTREGFMLSHGDVVIAAITSCTNTSNPYVMIGAGLVARKARELGMKVKPWVKTSLAPGSQVVTEYLEKTGLQEDLDAMGFNLVGYGCTTCIGNSGPLKSEIEEAIHEHSLVVTSVLSGNRNFEGRVHSLVKGNYLASPPLVVAYALAGNMQIDISNDPLGRDKNGKDVYLKDVWPSNQEIEALVRKTVTAEMFREKYSNVFAGDDSWKAIATSRGVTYDWNGESTYIQLPPFFKGMDSKLGGDVHDMQDMRILALLGDSITTDHISPAGNIAKNSPAASYLSQHGVEPRNYNSYGSRRGNHEVMMRGTFANIRIKNEMLDGVEGGYTRHVPSGEQLSIYEAAMRYQQEGTQLVVIAGQEYGTGSSRDWAAKGTKLLGAEAVIAESFERIHRSNLIGMGVLPLQFKDGVTRKSLNLTGAEKVSLRGLSGGISPGMEVECCIEYQDGKTETCKLLCRIDTGNELEYYRNGGILQYVIKSLMNDDGQDNRAIA